MLIFCGLLHLTDNKFLLIMHTLFHTHIGHRFQFHTDTSKCYKTVDVDSDEVFGVLFFTQATYHIIMELIQ